MSNSNWSPDKVAPPQASPDAVVVNGVRFVARTINIPASPPDGTDFTNSHAWSWEADPEETPRCYDCDAHMGGTSARWACGVRIPRVQRVFYSDGSREDFADVDYFGDRLPARAVAA